MDEIADLIITDKGREDLLETIMGYNFRDSALRTRAITRRAYVNDIKPGSMPEHEALATLGDAVIDLIVIINLMPESDDEGIISPKKSDLVRKKELTRIANEIGLKKCLRLGKCEGNTSDWDKGQALGESLESVIGAIYMDCYQRNVDGVRVCETVLKRVKLI